MEDLQAAGLAQTHLAKSVYDAGCGEFVPQLPISVVGRARLSMRWIDSFLLLGLVTLVVHGTKSGYLIESLCATVAVAGRQRLQRGS